MVDYLVDCQTFVTEFFFQVEVILYGASEVCRRPINDRCAVEYPFFFCEVIVSELARVLEYAVEYPPVNRGEAFDRKYKRRFGKQFDDVGCGGVGFFVVFGLVAFVSRLIII